MKAKPVNCTCTDRFTCRVCLDRCVERNKADRNNAPEAHAEKRIADHIDGYDRDDLGESPDY
jgi:hypothetical protein